MNKLRASVFHRHVALPAEHGAWVFLLSPLFIGLDAGGRFTRASAYLCLAALAVFLIRQPVTLLVKIASHRRSRRDLAASWFWISIYGMMVLIGSAGLIIAGFRDLLVLAIPGIPVFAWHLILVSRRSERRKAGVEIIGSGVLALAAPAAYWVGVGRPDPGGWWLFLLTWLQSAASIVYAYLRLGQRELAAGQPLAARLALGNRALLYAGFNFFCVGGLALGGWLPAALPLPYAVQLAETAWGTLNPATGWNPTHIGIRQLVISDIFTILFMCSWAE